MFAGGEANLGVYKMFADYFNHYLSINGAKNAEYQKTTTTPEGQVVELSFSEKEEKMNAALRKEIVRQSGISDLSGFPLETWASHPTLRWSMFAVVSALVDMILPDAVTQSVGLFSEVRNIGFGDSAAWDIKPRDLFVVSKAGKGKRTSEMHKQFNGQVTLIPEARQLTVAVSLYKVLAGKESLADFVAKVAQAMEVEFAYDIYNTFATAMDAISNTASTGLRVAGFTVAEFVRLSQTVTAWNGGAKALAVGTQAAISQIMPSDANYRYDIASEFVKVGYVKEFQGTSIMVLPQIADLATPFGLRLSDARIWLVSPAAGKIVKAVIEGSTIARTDDVNANANLMQTSTLNKSWACGIATSAVAGTISL
jgi:hypothetical protein